MIRMGAINEYDRILKKHKFTLKESIDDIILEGVHKSYDIGRMLNILNKHYNLELEEDFIGSGADIGIRLSGFMINNVTPGPNEAISVSLIINKDFPDKEKLKKFFQTCGWTNPENEFTYQKDSNYSVLVFEKNKQENEISVGEFVYHLTPSSKIEKILKNGLTPRSGDKASFKHIERVYVFLENPGYYMSANFAYDLWRQSLEQQTLNKEKLSAMFNAERPRYSLLQINTSKCGDIKFYGDPNLVGAVWTLDNIPPQAITVLYDKI